MARDAHIAAAQELIGPGEQIKAIGSFGLQDNYKANTAGAVAGSVAVPRSAGPLAGAAGIAVGDFAAKQANAKAEGVTERMLVAVTDSKIHVLAMPMVGGEPERVLISFPRESTEVEVKKFGLSRRLNLEERNTGQKLGLTGSTAKFAIGGADDKAVLAELAR